MVIFSRNHIQISHSLQKILHYILKSFWCMNMILGIFIQNDQMFDLKFKLMTVTDISWPMDLMI